MLTAPLVLAKLVRLFWTSPMLAPRLWLLENLVDGDTLRVKRVDASVYLYRTGVEISVRKARKLVCSTHRVRFFTGLSGTEGESAGLNGAG